MRTLLLADDSVTIRRVIELTFTDENVRVVSVSTGREAIERIDSAAAEKPDIVLADIGMADVSGYDIAAHVKGRADLRHIPVVLLAGAFEPLDEVRARKAGSDGVLVKPFEPQMVVARVRELLGRQRPGAAQSPAGAYAIAPPQVRAREAGASRAPESFERIEAAQHGAAPASPRSDEPHFDESLDQLDVAFAETLPPAIDEAVVSEFAQDLRDLRSSQSPAPYENHDFGDWDLPSRGSGPPPAVRPEEPWVEPARPSVVEPAPQAATPPPVDLPPPVTLDPLPAPPPTARVLPPAPPAERDTVTPQSAPSFARSAPPLADAFSSLLAAEEGRAPAPLPAAPSSASAPLSDADVERIVDRVILKLGANVRGTVIDLAESLVRAEIDRLKALR